MTAFEIRGHLWCEPQSSKLWNPNHWDYLAQSLPEYKAMNVARQCRIFVELSSNSKHIALWRNYGFPHSFHDSSKSNAFRKILIRTEFILHEIFFRMSILSTSKTSWMFFNLNFKNDTSRFSAYNNYYFHDTGRNCEPIFIKFT